MEVHGMKRFAVVLLGAVTASALAVPVAHAASGEVAVFTVEMKPLEVYEDPKGCKALPDGAHVLVNRTSKAVTIHGDPQCRTPAIVVVEKDYGSHVPAEAGAFKA
jgi:hypothetical protein